MVLSVSAGEFTIEFFEAMRAGVQSKSGWTLI
jgi:hypothetical protein